MHISVSYRFNHEETPAAVTGVEGDVTDLLRKRVVCTAALSEAIWVGV